MIASTKWADNAACKGEDANVFFPAYGGADDSSTTKKEWNDAKLYAKSICAKCPVRRDCLEYAIQTREPDGIWGGMTGDERKKEIAVRVLRQADTA